MNPDAGTQMEELTRPRERVRETLRTWLSFIQLARPLRIVLLVALVNGLLNYLLIPPWWHYDEPGHFEYAWLAAHSSTWPVIGQYDQSMRREMAKSMLQYGWYQVRNIKPDLKSSQPIPIGIPQVGDQPGYYFLASLPLRLMPNAPIIVQYFAAHSVSLLLYLLIIVVVWYALGEILSYNHPLRWMTSVFIALLPAFADAMVAVDNDVSAVLAASLFLWASLRLIQKGYSVGRLLFLAASLAACYLSKSTALFVFALTPLVLILAFLRGKFQVWFWGSLGVGLIILGVLALQWGSPLAWYQTNLNRAPVRVQATHAPLGNYAFELPDSNARVVTTIAQIMPPDEVGSLRGKTVTLGAWIWANQPTKAMPVFIQFTEAKAWGINPASYSPRELISITTRPTFYATTFIVPADTDHATLRIGQRGRGIPHNNVFFDGLVLATGDFGTTVPTFTDANGLRGTWNGQEFVNLVRNGSAEQASFELQSWFSDNTIGNALRHSPLINPFLSLAAIQDWKGTGRYFLDTADIVFRTFWVSLANDKTPLRSRAVSGFLLAFTAAGVAGVPIKLWKQRKSLRWDLIGFLGIFLLLPWLVLIVRSASTLTTPVLLFGWARYAYPAILPTALFLCAGWLAWLELLSTALKWSWETQEAIFTGIVLGISAFVILNVIQVFHADWIDKWVSPLLLFLFMYMGFHWFVKWQAHVSLQPPPSGSTGPAGDQSAPMA